LLPPQKLKPHGFAGAPQVLGFGLTSGFGVGFGVGFGDGDGWIEGDGDAVCIADGD